MKYLWKTGFVELPGVIVIVCLLLGPLALVAVSGYLRDLYGQLVRRYERSLDDAYSVDFQRRATEARTLNANVGYALNRAKRTVDEVRRSSPDELRVHIALGQVSEWLDSAAQTSDRALRSLEDERIEAKNSHVRIFTKDCLDD